MSPLATLTLRIYLGTALALLGATALRGQLDVLMSHALAGLAYALR